jgi:hypothetical protein
VTALETILRQLTGAKAVRGATDALKRHGGWGPERLLNDGSSIWESVHALYPDVRHGNPTPSALPHDEATYWIRRIIAFVQYLTERRAAVGGGK